MATKLSSCLAGRCFIFGLGTDVPHEASRLVSCMLCTPSGLGKKMSRARTE